MRKYNFHESEFIISPSMACYAAPSYASSGNSNFDGCNAKTSPIKEQTNIAWKFMNYAWNLLKAIFRGIYAFVIGVITGLLAFIGSLLGGILRLIADWLALNAGIAIVVTGLYFVLLFFLYPRMQFSVQHLMTINLISLVLFNWKLIIASFAVAFALYGFGILH